jgi:hypothetical protein
MIWINHHGQFYQLKGPKYLTNQLVQTSTFEKDVLVLYNQTWLNINSISIKHAYMIWKCVLPQKNTQMC